MKKGMNGNIIFKGALFFLDIILLLFLLLYLWKIKRMKKNTHIKIVCICQYSQIIALKAIIPVVPCTFHTQNTCKKDLWNQNKIILLETENSMCAFTYIHRVSVKRFLFYEFFIHFFFSLLFYNAKKGSSGWWLYLYVCAIYCMYIGMLGKFSDVHLIIYQKTCKK